MKLTKMLCRVYVLFFLVMLSGCFGDSNVESVKNGTLSFDSSTTVGNALNGNKYFTNPQWTSFEDEQKRIFVQFEANIDILSIKNDAKIALNAEIMYGINTISKSDSIYNDIDAKILCQFIINRDETFDIQYVGLMANGGEYISAENQVYDFITAIYNNELPFASQFYNIVQRCTVIDIISKEINNNGGKFYMIPPSSQYIQDRMLSDAAHIEYYRTWSQIETDGAFVAINSISFDSINMDASFLLQGIDNSTRGDIVSYTFTDATVPINKIRFKIAEGLPRLYVPLEINQFRLAIRSGLSWSDSTLYTTDTIPLFIQASTATQRGVELDGKTYVLNNNFTFEQYIEPVESELPYKIIEKVDFVKISDDGIAYTFKNRKGDLYTFYISDQVGKGIIFKQAHLYLLKNETFTLHVLGDTIISMTW